MKTHAKYDSHGGCGVQVLLFQRAGNKMRQMRTGCVKEPGEWGGDGKCPPNKLLCCARVNVNAISLAEWDYSCLPGILVFRPNWWNNLDLRSNFTGVPSLTRFGQENPVQSSGNYTNVVQCGRAHFAQLGVTSLSPTILVAPPINRNHVAQRVYRVIIPPRSFAKKPNPPQRTPCVIIQSGNVIYYINTQLLPGHQNTRKRRQYNLNAIE